ncbi:hypothetical protein QR721_04865 [Aciduricibacillus chroicocephali]|uniref:Phosphotyrosine protein phosphatase I domain-containing protein n=1 Tax=Aciduricibacillus chroicocephali TaxID=3054939 RepID=A0ABY9KXR9_9BACI|nr:hypothetical protein QR721_04865 [Bacillaceae bacterium 44XB]
MNIYIDNCYSWVGYHIANDFLEHGWTVCSQNMPRNEGEDHLAMFLGRNSRFHSDDFIENPDARILIETECSEEPSLTVLANERKWHISCPFLIGEWMPLDGDHLYNGCESELVYTCELSDFLRQSLNGNLPNGHVQFISRHSKRVPLDCSGVAVSLSELAPEEKLMKVKDHFNRFRHLYI